MITWTLAQVAAQVMDNTLHGSVMLDYFVEV